MGISEIVFSLGASAYTFTLSPGHAVSFQGPGIANNSGVVQNFVAAGDGAIFFLNFSSAGDSTTLLTAQASPATGRGPGTIDFPDFSSGGNATIVSGGSAVAGAFFNAIANNRLTVGTALIALSNTSATRIRGTFANLVDGSTFSVGKNTYQVSYEGGDGNDLTFIVIP